MLLWLWWKSFINVAYSWDISRFNFNKNHWNWTWKILKAVTGHIGLRLNLWDNELELEKYLNYLTWQGLVLWYIGIRLEKYSDYLTGFGLILWYIGLGLEKHLH